MASRKSLVEAWQQVEQVCCSLDGKAPEMSDKVAATAMAKALWLVLDFIVRGIDYDTEQSTSSTEAKGER